MIMEQAFTELPLAIFTTLAPIGAGAFIALAIAFFTTSFDEDRLKRVDRMTLIPLIVTVVGFIASFAHLASPLNAFYVFSGLGTSPLSNEIAIGTLFVIVAFVYWILAVTGRLKEGVRKVFAGVVAVLAVVFALFTGLAYSIGTIPTWSTPAVPVSLVGFALMGGMLLGALTLGLAGALEEACQTPFKAAAVALGVAGLVLGIAGAWMQYGLASGMSTALIDGAALASGATGYLAGFIVLALAGTALGAYALIKRRSTALVGVSVAFACVGVFAARLVFYALEISVGL